MFQSINHLREAAEEIVFQDLQTRVPLLVKLVLVLELMRETLEKHSVT